MKHVREKDFDEMAELFQMLADTTRLKILKQLFLKECCVSELVSALGMSQSAVSHQLSSLKKTRVVKSKKVGRNVFYGLDDKHIESIFKLTLEHIQE
ncbi:MAG: ArsR/SmtB family transcription factor [Anaerorhabdus sp.]